MSPSKAVTTPTHSPIRIFVSSPGDVERERCRARVLIERIGREYAPWTGLEAYFWEHEPHDPSSDFTSSIGSTADYDIVVVILWGRLGNRLHSSHRRKDGAVYRSGTEYEVLTALEAQGKSERRLPKLGVFLNTSPVQILASDTDPSKADEQLRQYRLLGDFLNEHFQTREEGPGGEEILTNRRAYTAYRTLDQFEELLEKQLRHWLDSLLAAGPGRDDAVQGNRTKGAKAAWSGNPYQGLSVFEPEHAPIFFGRTRAIGHLVERVRERFGSGRGFVLVFGASGSGKSSLVRAGLLPLVTEPGVIPGVNLWRRVILKPSDGGEDPFSALAAALMDQAALPELVDGEVAGPARAKVRGELAGSLRQGPAAVTARIEECLRGAARVGKERQSASLLALAEQFDREGRLTDAEEARTRAADLPPIGAGLLLVVDQMEELFTTVGEESRRAFLDTLAALAESRFVMLVATLRSDFYAECEGHDGLMKLKEGSGSYHLPAPSPVEIGQMIREPAIAAGVVFEETGSEGRLDERILKAAQEDPDSLPLLEFCLRKLYETGQGDGVLRHRDYEAIGELSGVLTQHAEEVFSSLAAAERDSLEEVIRALATLGGGEGPGVGDAGAGPVVVRRVVPYASLAALPGASGLVDRFIAERLFSGGLDTSGMRVVSVTHEALLRKWDRVSAWLGLDENRRFLEVRARVGQRLRQWEENDRDASFLLQAGRELEEAEIQLTAFPLAFHEDERDFIHASRDRVAEAGRRKARVRRIVMAALVTLSLVALGMGAWAMSKQREAIVERDQARHNEGLGWLLRAKIAEESGARYPDTLLYAAKAIGFAGFGRPVDLGEAEEPLRLLREGDDDGGAFERARDWISSRPAYVPVWASECRPGSPVGAMAIDPSGRWLAIGGEEGVRVFDFLSERATVLPGTEGTSVLALHPAGKRLAVSDRKNVGIWDVAEDGFRKETTLPDSEAVTSLVWSSDGEMLVGAMRSGGLVRWLESSETKHFGGGDGGLVSSLTFSPENSFAAGVVEGFGPRVWFPDHGVAASVWTELEPEGTGRLEESERENFRMRISAAKRVTCLAVSPDGTLLATGTDEGRDEGGTAGAGRLNGGLLLWNAGTAAIAGEISSEQRHEGGVISLAFRPDGAMLASGSRDGTIKLWAVAGSRLSLLASLTGHHGAVTRLAFSPGGTRLASAGGDGSAKLWSVEGEPSGNLDLFVYLKRDFYRIDPELRWQSGSGFANETAAGLTAVWSPSNRGELEERLLASASKAAAERRWRTVAMRMGEMRRLGAVVPEELEKEWANRWAKDPANPGDAFHNGEGMEFLWCPPTGPDGFIMGDSSEPGDYLRHPVILTKGFWLAKHEVTQAHYEAVVGRNPAVNRGAGAVAPVENVSWEEAMAFCRRLTDGERARGTIPPGWEYRLPTEAEWEYACRAGTDSRWSFGYDESQLHRYANFNDRSGDFDPAPDETQDDGHKYSAPVGSYLPNPWGFHDMHGNVFEWCLDAIDRETSAYPEGPVTDPRNDSGSQRIYRGGGFGFPASDSRSSYRGADLPTNRGNIGLRPVLARSDAGS